MRRVPHISILRCGHRAKRDPPPTVAPHISLRIQPSCHSSNVEVVPEDKMTPTALIAGVTGIVGNNLANQLLSNGWQVYGLARHPSADIKGVDFIAADLLDPIALRTAVADLKPTHVFITTRLRQPTEQENIRDNSAMVRNL